MMGRARASGEAQVVAMVVALLRFIVFYCAILRFIALYYALLRFIAL